jgi:hypothetical protein
MITIASWSRYSSEVFQHALGEVFDRAQFEDARRGLDHLDQAAAVAVERHQVAVGGQAGVNGGEQLLARQLGFFLVVVDVVVGDDLVLRRLARLAGAQDDAHEAVLELLADVARHLEPGLLGLHDHVQQDQRDVAVGRQDAARLGAGVGADQLQPPVGELELLQRQAGDDVDFLLVIHDQHLPEARLCRRGRQ